MAAIAGGSLVRSVYCGEVCCVVSGFCVKFFTYLLVVIWSFSPSAAKMYPVGQREYLAAIIFFYNILKYFKIGFYVFLSKNRISMLDEI